jgi:hypothetical protein
VPFLLADDGDPGQPTFKMLSVRGIRRLDSSGVSKVVAQSEAAGKGVPKLLLILLEDL